MVLVLSAIYDNFAPLKFIRVRFDRKKFKYGDWLFLFQSDIPQNRVSSRGSEEAIDQSESRMTRAILAFQREAWANDVCECTMIGCNWTEIARINNREWTKTNREQLMREEANIVARA